MTPIEYRQAAGKYQREHKDATVVSAFIAGCLFASEQQPVFFTDDAIKSPILDNLFDTIWNLYDRKDNKQSALRAWQKLSHNEQQRALAHIPHFVRAHPDKKYRPMLATYINQKRFNDEEIISNEQSTSNPTQQRLDSYAAAIANVGRQG